MDLSVAVAKIGTYLDQVVDVFYVTDQQGQKIEQRNRNCNRLPLAWSKPSIAWARTELAG